MNNKNKPYVKQYNEKRELLNPITKQKPYLHAPVFIGNLPHIGSKFHKTNHVNMSNKWDAKKSKLTAPEWMLN